MDVSIGHEALVVCWIGRTGMRRYSAEEWPSLHAIHATNASDVPSPFGTELAQHLFLVVHGTLYFSYGCCDGSFFSMPGRAAMLSLPGQSTRTCDGFSRREWLRVGGLSSLGLGLPQLLAAERQPSPSSPSVGVSFGRAKSCIVLFLFGAPAHQDTWDMKPDAPAEVRGEFQPITSSIPGLTVCEHMPQLSRLVDRLTQIRSVTHPDNTHTVAMHYMLTGVRHQRPKTNPQNAGDDFPCFGAAVNYLDALNGQRQRPIVPTAISLNAPANQVSANNHIFPGFFAGFLGSRFDPLFIADRPNQQPFAPLPAAASPARTAERRRLLQRVQRQAAPDQRWTTARAFDQYYQQAFDLLTGSAARRAFRLSDESQSLRDEYGSTPFGQGCLLARRLVESGSRLVTVNWQRDDAFWDTHADNFNKHKKLLLPNLDRGFSALLRDLEQRGMLDETLVVCLAEFGRTPKINSKAGRDHWAACNTVLLAGAGTPGGLVYGASDKQAAYPVRDPVSPDDLAATVYHLLGIDPHSLLPSLEGRPRVLSEGVPISAVL